MLLVKHSTTDHKIEGSNPDTAPHWEKILLIYMANGGSALGKALNSWLCVCVCVCECVLTADTLVSLYYLW